MKQSRNEDWELYERGVDYLNEIGLYRTVNLNESFYAGDQWCDDWGGRIETNGLPAPVFNVLKRVLNFLVSSVTSQRVEMRYFAEDMPSGMPDPACSRLNAAAAGVWRRLGMDSLINDALLDAAVTGNGVLFTYWDPNVKCLHGYHGDFVTRLIDSVNLFVSDPSNADIQSQDWVMISGRKTVNALRKEAVRSGVPESECALIAADDDSDRQAGRLAGKEPHGVKCTFLLKMWRDPETGHVLYRKSVKNTVITPHPVDTGLLRYPLAHFQWDKRKGSIIGQAPATGLIPNQRYINQSFAMVMYHMMMTAFSKVVYNADKIEGGWDNSIGSAIPVTGGVDDAAKIIQGGDMQPGMLDTIDRAIKYTRELMGATEAALGNVDPTNTSAIIALQKTSAIPLNIVKRNLYRCIEELGLIWLDFMLAFYPDDRLVRTWENGREDIVRFCSSEFRQRILSCSVQAGPSDYYSSVAAVSTLDKLLEGGHISFLQYLEQLPDEVLPDKNALRAAAAAAAARGTDRKEN